MNANASQNVLFLLNSWLLLTFHLFSYDSPMSRHPEVLHAPVFSLNIISVASIFKKAVGRDTVS